MFRKMAANGDAKDPLQANLAGMERYIQHLIDALTRLPPSQSKRTCIQQRRDLRTTITQHGVVLKPYKSTCDVDASLSDLRQRMRKLRRWRNGSESWSVSELEELVEFLLLTKANVVTYRLSLLLAVIDVMRKQWQASSPKRDMLDDDLATELTCLRDGARILHRTLRDTHARDTPHATLRLIEEKLDDFESSARSLKRQLCSSDARRRSLIDSDAADGCRRRPESVYSRIEDDPLVNRLLKNDSRLRRLISVFRRGKHVTLDNDHSAQTCAVNDIDVLKGQLRKLERWRQCEASFTTDDLDDLELTVSAIEGHISDDVVTISTEPSHKPTLCHKSGEEKEHEHQITKNGTATPSLLMSVELYNDSDDSTIPESEEHLVDERLI